MTLATCKQHFREAAARVVHDVSSTANNRLCSQVVASLEEDANSLGLTAEYLCDEVAALEPSAPGNNAAGEGEQSMSGSRDGHKPGRVGADQQLLQLPFRNSSSMRP